VKGQAMALSDMLRDTLRDYLFEEMRRDSQTIAALQNHPIDDPEENFDTYVRSCLKRGQCLLNSRTISLWYTYTYMLMHGEAFQYALRHPPRLFDRLKEDLSDATVFDFGCGPLTCSLALADLNTYYERPPVNMTYVGIDDCAAIRQLGKSIVKRYAGFGPNYNQLLFKNWNAIDAASLDGLSDKNGTVIFCFSYFFGQDRVEQATASSVADAVSRIVDQLSQKHVYVVYTTAAHTATRFPDFKSRLGLPNSEPKICSYDCHFPRRLRDFQSARMDGKLALEVVSLR
jgi:hypothetical protein